MLPRLESRLVLLGGGGSRDLPARQQTLRGAIAWSFDLLDEPGRCLFARLSAFVGGFELEAAEAVCGPSTSDRAALDVFGGISELVDQSLVRQSEEHAHVRFGMLETIREFAAERLAAGGEAAEIRRRHAAHYTAVAERAAPNLVGGERSTWLDRLEHEHDNLRAAIGWAIETGDAATALRLVAALWRFWQSRAFLGEGAMRAEAVLALPADEVDPAIRLRAHDAAGGLAYWMGDMERSKEHYRRSLALARATGDRRSIADQLYNLSFTFIISRNDLPQGLAVIQEATDLYRELGDEAGLVNSLWGLGNVHYFEEDWAKAAEIHEEAYALAVKNGNEFTASWSLHMLGSAEVKLGRLNAAFGHLRDALLAMVAARETTGIVLLLFDFSELAYVLGDLPGSFRLWGAARRLQEETGTGLAGFANELMSRFELPTGDLSAAEVEALRAEGRALSTDEAVVLALGTPGPPATQ